MRILRMVVIIIVLTGLVGLTCVIVAGSIEVIRIISLLIQIDSRTDARETLVKETMEDIALRLGVSSNWEEIERYIYCEITKPGRSREEVETNLSIIGNYKAIEGPAPEVPTGITLYRFDEDAIYWVIRGIYVDYDADKVTEVTLREGGGSLEASVDRQFDCQATTTPMN